LGVFNFFANAARKLNSIVTSNVVKATDDLSELEKDIVAWKMSPERAEQIKGSLYYEGHHDILYKKRTAIGKGGKEVELTNLPNRKDIDNQYAIAVDKKANYFLGKPMAIKTDNEEYSELLKAIFDMKMQRRLKNTVKKSFNNGIAWVFPYYDENSNLKFKVFPGYEIKPYWNDDEHTELYKAVRSYPIETIVKGQRKTIEKVEVYKPDGVYRYILDDNDKLTADTEAGEYESYISLNGMPYNWDRIPLIAFKYNDSEIPLIRKAKSLQDAINELMSMFHNHMLEDNRNTILVIENFDGQDLGEFRQNLAEYGAVKVRTGEGAKGGVSTLSIEVNAGNYQLILQLLKNALIENTKSYDGKMLNSGTPNQMNILSMYQDIDIDTNDLESEYQAALEELLFFINTHLALTGQGDFFEEKVEFIFNRDMLMNESEIMQTLVSAGVKISNRTLLSQVPFIDDVDAELEQIKKESEENMEMYQNAFPQEQEDNADVVEEDEE